MTTPDFAIVRGRQLDKTFTFRQNGALINLTNWTSMMVFMTEEPLVDLTLTQVNGITLGGAAGTAIITVTATQATALSSTKSRMGTFQLKLVSSTGQTINQTGSFTTETDSLV